jgi:ADP-L-glycero-D-manno-heptose 6-epimerase
MILVTGSKGFIGRNLVAALKVKGEEVYEFDTIDYPPGNFTFRVPFHKITKIYHLGAISSTLETNVGAIYRHNVEFSIDLFNTAISHQIPVVYTSSASVFGNTMKDETYIHNPLNHYALSKAQMEMWIEEHFDEFKHISVHRLFNVYGEDERKTDTTMSPICKFTKQAKETGVITLFTNSYNMIRDFVAVENVVQKMIDNPRAGFHDVGTGYPISFQEVAELIADKYNATIRYIPMPDEIKRGYQYYTKSRILNFNFYTVEDWLKIQS